MHLADIIGRIFLSSIFLFEGIRKLFIQEQTIEFMVDYGVPEILFFPSLIVEIVFPLLIIIGYKTKLAALVMTIFTITVTIIFHTEFSNEMQIIIFLKNIAIAGGFLIIFAKNTGKYSIDYKIN
tara:strand:+ start:73 stop:444 length:372 start_codon:yes stop_codon:yes gene_type:complete